MKTMKTPSENKTVRMMTVEFDRRIRADEIPMFRVAIISSMDKAPVQFHNHGDTGLVYSYPLVQYKRIDGNAAVICLGDSIKETGTFFSHYHDNLMIGQQESVFNIKSIRLSDIDVHQAEKSIGYSIKSWLPFNQDNYEKFKSLEGLSEKCAMMEKILTGNILSFAKGLGIYLDFGVECLIQQISHSGIRKFKNVQMTAYDIEFRCNVELPDHIGLGKGVSHGFGMLIRKY